MCSSPPAGAGAGAGVNEACCVLLVAAWVLVVALVLVVAVVLLDDCCSAASSFLPQPASPSAVMSAILITLVFNVAFNFSSAVGYGWCARRGGRIRWNAPAFAA